MRLNRFKRLNRLGGFRFMCDPDDRIRDPHRLAVLRASGLLDSPPEASFDRLVRLAARLTRATASAVSLVDEDRQFFKAAIGLDPAVASKRETALDQSICRRVVATGEPLILSDLRGYTALGEGKPLAYLGIPLVTGDGQVLGSFCVLDEAPRTWSEEDIATVTDLAASVATEIELRLDIERRVRLERELSEAKGRFEAYMRNSPALAFAKDLDGRFTYLNSRFYQSFGPGSDWIGKTDADLFPAEVAERIQANDREVRETGTPVGFIEETLTADDRRKRWLTFKFPYVTPAGEHLLGGMAIDISDLLQTQEALRRSEAESRTLAMVVSRIDGAVAIANTDGRLEWASEPYARLFGAAPEAILGQDLIQGSLGLATNPAEVARLRSRLIAGDRVEVAAVRSDARGRKAWLELEVQAVRGQGGTPDQFIAIARDVTARHRSEQRLTAIRECDTILFDSTTLDEAVPRLLRSIGQALDLDQATFWRQDDQGHRLIPRFRWWPSAQGAANGAADGSRAGGSVDPAPVPDQQLAGRIWADPHPTEREDHAPWADPSLPGEFGWPVISRGAVIGVFTFASSEPVEAIDDLVASLQRQVSLFVGRKLVEEERNRLVAIFEASDDFVGIADVNGLVIWRNAAYHRLVGRGSNAAESGFPFGSTYTDSSARLLLEVAHPEADRSGSWLGETAIQTVDGRVVPMSQRVTAHRGPDGEVAYYATILRDITAIKRAEVELLAAKDAAEAASRAKGDFLANMSHEIRTPMNGILGMTDLTLDTDLSPLQREYLGLVRTSAESLMRVINDILDFSKIESGRFELEVVPFNLHDLIYETLRPLALRAHSVGLELACRVTPGVPELVIGDPHRLRQVLVNLVGNAVKFTPTGEVVVQVAADPDPVAPPDDSPAGPQVALRFTVTDTGIGIPTSKLSAIFEPFEQADGGTTRTYGGTGLGLTISSELVRLMGGRLWVESTLGHGSAFHFTSRLGSVSQQPDHPERAALVGRRVLVAVADATRQRLTVEALADWGAIAREVAGGVPALNELRRAFRAGEGYDFAVVDDQLRDLGGFDLIHLIHADPALSRTGLVMMTTAGRSDMGRCEDQKIARCVAKPVAPRDLLDALISSVAPSSPTSPAATGPSVSGVPSLRGPLGPAPIPSPDRPAAPPTARSLRVLLAEDQMVNRKVAARMLERLGHSVVTARDGREVLALLGDGSFDVVLMDIQMPVMDGFETAAAIRGSDHSPVALVALTAYAMKGDRERCLAAGFDDYVSKPIGSDDLRDALERLSVQASRTTDQRVAT